LLAEGTGMLRRLRDGTAEADRTVAVLRQMLPPDIAAQVWGAILKDGTLTVLVRSAAWGTRLRYLAPEFADKVAEGLGATVDKVKVKVRAGRG
jgi:predicted nucleic acid-binding Zn ribbon protein